MSKNLILFGLAIVALGVLWPVLQKLQLGKLPGDIMVKKEGFRFYFPLTSSILVSLIITLLLWLFKK